MTPIEDSVLLETCAEPRFDVDRFDDEPDRGYIWFVLPLDGCWSTVTAIFDFHRHQGAVVLELEDIHAM